MRVLARLACLLAALAWTGAAGAGSGLEVSDAWVRHAPPALKVHAGYLALANKGADTRRLVGVESSDYAKVEMHASRTHAGISTMEPVAQVEIAPGQTVRFEPGGLHLMLIGPKAVLRAGSSVSLSLVLDDGSRLQATAAVRKNASAPAPDHAGHKSHAGH